MTNGDKQARSLTLSNVLRPKATKAQRGLFVITPRMNNAEAIQLDSTRRCVYYNKTGKVTNA